jgi:hypothetical protein
MQVLGQQQQQPPQPQQPQSKHQQQQSSSVSFSLQAEHNLITSILQIVQPPKKPLNSKIILRRAPTQEEFFRGSLSKNPISLQMLMRSNHKGGNNDNEPTIRDLRQHIATDLQMGDSAELLELLVANKIVDVDLKLRVVHQVLWKNHLLLHSTNSTTTQTANNAANAATASSTALSSFLSSRGGARSFIATGSGLSMIFNSGLERLGGAGGAGGSSSAITAETPLAALPPMIVTYRLTGVDGEATEDTVTRLQDPEAPSETASPEEVEQLLEQQYGITRLVTGVGGAINLSSPTSSPSSPSTRGGIVCLLRSVERNISDTVRKIRRDDVDHHTTRKTPNSKQQPNPSRTTFKQSSPFPGLTLLMCCSKLPSNRTLLLQSRAPTILLRLLLDVLHALEEKSNTVGVGGVDHGTSNSNTATSTADESSTSESNATAKQLQELIEVLASDMLASSSAVETDDDGDANDADAESSTTLRLLLSAIETSSLSRPLRNVIAKLLPYLTYGQKALSKELAYEFVRHVSFDTLGEHMTTTTTTTTTTIPMEDDEQQPQGTTPTTPTLRSSTILMATFVHASVSLPPNDVCNSLRFELLECGFLKRLSEFLLRDIPTQPPSWSPSLWNSSSSSNTKGQQELTSTTTTTATTAQDNKQNEQLAETQWRDYVQRPGLKTAFDMLIGLSRQHEPTQCFLGSFETTKTTTGQQQQQQPPISLIRACHWIEATSDNTSARICMNGLGLVAEMLLDELAENESSKVAQQVRAVRRKTRDRKKEIAMERRSKALVSMSSFGPMVGTTLEGGCSKHRTNHNHSSSSNNSNDPATIIRGTAASLLAPVLGLFRDNHPPAADSSSSSPPPAKRRKKDTITAPSPTKPAWMAEMEDMEDETGLTCAVCQEGRTLQPIELLGLYAYVKKVSVPLSQCGGRSSIDGTTLLTVLPPTIPDSLADSHAALEWYPSGRAAGEELRESARGSSLSSSVANSRRATYFTTTVSGGNAIHFSCHTKARQADRSHPKAPKSEWEGASLRNSRVNCNVIMPLVSSRSSKVPLVAVDVALTDHQTAVSNLLGARPKSMLWTVLHDVRLLLLRMAYGEPLNADCGGGSLASNSQLVFYQLLMADMFEKDAQVDAPETAQHARGLSAGFLAASAITKADDYDKSNQTALLRGLADSSLMASLTSILFHNTKDDYSSAPALDDDDDQLPHSKRRWLIGKEYFLRGLLNCAGRRHALGVENSGCITGRNSGKARSRSNAFAEWEIVDDGDDIMDDLMDMESSLTHHNAIHKQRTSSSGKAGIDDFRDALRPMIVFYAMMDQLSLDFVLNIMDDVQVEECANRLVQVIEGCHRAKNIHELLRKAKVTLAHDDIIDELQKGMISA